MTLARDRMRAMRALHSDVACSVPIAALGAGAAAASRLHRRSPVIFPEQQGPPANYLGYAFVQCGPANAPGLRIVALQGLIPEGIPKAPPRPSIELVIPGTVETALGKQFTVVPKPAAESAVAFSCPVVGDCAPAETGALVVTSRTDSGALVGEFQREMGDRGAACRPLHRRLARIAGEVRLDHNRRADSRHAAELRCIR